LPAKLPARSGTNSGAKPSGSIPATRRIKSGPGLGWFRSFCCGPIGMTRWQG